LAIAHWEITLGYRTLGDHSHTWKSHLAIAHLEIALGYRTLGGHNSLSHTWRLHLAAHLEVTLGYRTK